VLPCGNPRREQGNEECFGCRPELRGIGLGRKLKEEGIPRRLYARKDRRSEFPDKLSGFHEGFQLDLAFDGFDHVLHVFAVFLLLQFFGFLQHEFVEARAR